MIDGNTCVEDEVTLCLPCDIDADCAARAAGALCLELPDQRRCGIPCSGRNPCPRPFSCDSALGQCVPEGSFCACEGVSDPVEVACLARGTAANQYCAGVAMCTPRGLSECTISSVESCDGADNDCNGKIDEDFVDARGRYVGRLHCGACNKPCAPPGEHYEATCVAPGTSTPSCQVACSAGFVDVDGIQGNGCECQRFDGSYWFGSHDTFCDADSCTGPGGCVTSEPTCEGTLAPVCGCDGMTYQNRCEARRAMVRITHTGACP
jgi:hypothetical protein